MRVDLAWGTRAAEPRPAPRGLEHCGRRGAAGLPPLAAPLAGYAGAWAGCAGRGPVGATACAAWPALVAAYGLYRWLDASGLHLLALALGVLVLGPVVMRALAVREARHGPARAGFTGG